MRETYPGLGFDPTPGEAAEVAALVACLSSGRGAVSSAASTLGRATRPGAWRGPAASAFLAGTAALPPVLDELSASLDSAGRALAAWRERLTANKREADRLDRAARTLRQRLADADQAVVLARGEAVGPAVEHRQAVREALERVLAEARRLRARHRRQAVAAAGAVRASTGPAVPALGWQAGSTSVARGGGLVSGWTGEVAAIVGGGAVTVAAGVLDPARGPVPVERLPLGGDRPSGVERPAAARLSAGGGAGVPVSVPVAGATVAGSGRLGGSASTWGSAGPGRSVTGAEGGVDPVGQERTGAALDRAGVDRGGPERRSADRLVVDRSGPGGGAEGEPGGRTEREPAGAGEPTGVRTASSTAPVPETGRTAPQSELPPEPRLAADRAPAIPAEQPATRGVAPVEQAGARPVGDPVRPTTSDPGHRSHGPVPASPDRAQRTPGTPTPTRTEPEPPEQADLGLAAILAGAAPGSTHDTRTERFGRLAAYLLRHPGERPVLAFLLVRRDEHGRLARRALFLPGVAPVSGCLDSPRSTRTPTAPGAASTDTVH